MKIKHLFYYLLAGVCIWSLSDAGTVKAASLPSAYCSDTDVDLDKATTADSPEWDCVTSYKQQHADVCWAYAGISTAESSLLANYPSSYNASSLDLSEYHLAYFNKHLYNKGINLWNPVYPDLDVARYRPGEDMGGIEEETIASFAAWVGPVMEKICPPADTIPTAYSKYSALLPDGHATGKTVRQLQNTYAVNVYDLDAMKQMILKYGAGIYSYYSRDMDSLHFIGSEAAYYYTGKIRGTSHEVSIIGWDDHYSRNNFRNSVTNQLPKRDGAWLVKNSWRSDLSYWISFENETVRTWATFLDFGNPQSYQAYDYNYQYDSIGTSTVLNDNDAARDSVSQMGNIFTAQNNITVKAAGFYTQNDNTGYKVCIYRNSENMENPTDGMLVSTYEDTMTYAGYHVVHLPEVMYVKVKKGEHYSVVVEIHDAEHGNPLMENGSVISGYSKIESCEGISFYRFSQTADWIDRGGNAQDPSVFRIKAFADASVYPVSISSESNRYASMECSTLSVESGQTLTFKVKPANGYTLASLGVLVNGQKVTGTDGIYTVRNIDENIEIAVIGPATKFNVSFDANGGILSGASSATYTYGTGMTLPTSISKTGYTFQGWGYAGSYHTKISPQDYGDRAYYAGWAANKYTIHYDANGGSGTMSDSVKTYDVAGKLSANRYTMSGKSFAGWNTKADGTGTFYGEQEKVSNLASVSGATVTLYAQWTNHSYSIQFTANGGNGVMPPLEVSYGIRIRLSSGEFTKTGCTFAGWNSKADGTGTSYNDMEEVSNLVEDNGGTITLYAQWKPITYTIHFDGNGYTLGNKDLTATYDTPVILPYVNCASNIGYIITGWSTGKNSGEVYEERDAVSNLCSEDGGTVTLYAAFRALTYNIDYQDAGVKNIDSAYYQYTYGTGKELPSDMEKLGYVFSGWYSEEDGKIVSSISPTMYGEKTFTAMWKPASYGITYKTCIPRDVTFERQDYYYYGDLYTLPTDLTAEDYTFVGWQLYNRDEDFLMGSNVITEITPTMYGEVTVYAKWIDKDGNIYLPSNGIYEGSTASPAPSGTQTTVAPTGKPSATPVATPLKTPSSTSKPTPTPTSGVQTTSTPSVQVTTMPTLTPTMPAVQSQKPVVSPTPTGGNTAVPTSEPEWTPVPSRGSVRPVPSHSPAYSPRVAKNFTSGTLKYKITQQGKVAVAGCRNKKIKTVRIPASVKSKGITYRVTAIGNNAFSKMKKLRSVVIGKNVTVIGGKAFYNCRKLKKVTIQSKKITKWGKKAFKGIYPKASINVPKSKRRAYKRGLQRAGGKEMKDKKK